MVRERVFTVSLLLHDIGKFSRKARKVHFSVSELLKQIKSEWITDDLPKGSSYRRREPEEESPEAFPRWDTSATNFLREMVVE
jgi:CRISPR/Cas system-associated protein Cas10 (large subunit of type III CRISPR-Cas system)